MGTEENKALYRRYIQEVFNEGRIELLDELLSPDYVYRDAPPGVPPGAAAVAEVVRMFRAAFPDLHISIEAQVAEGDKVVSLATTRGTHTGTPILEIPPAGRKLSVTGARRADN
jgi:predicted ester cyclase